MKVYALSEAFLDIALRRKRLASVLRRVWALKKRRAWARTHADARSADDKLQRYLSAYKRKRRHLGRG